MAMPGETLFLGADPICPDCRCKPELAVYASGAGYYIGTWCHCGPYTRESLLYWNDRLSAELALETGNWEPR